jgi:hypothetical protein
MKTRGNNAFRHSAKVFAVCANRIARRQQPRPAYRSQRWNALSSTRWRGDGASPPNICAFGGCLGIVFRRSQSTLPATQRSPESRATLGGRLNPDGISQWIHLHASRGHSRVSSSDSPVSKRLLRLARICGHPVETASMNFEPSFSIS